MMVRLLLVSCLAGAIACADPRDGVLVPDGSPSFTLMDFSEPFPLDPPPVGWSHRTFWFHRPMEMAFATKEGVAALRLATHDTASMLFRHVEVALDAYPLLSWRWYIETDLDGAIDERTRAGDDHPARLFLVVEERDGTVHRMEIIWGNRLAAGTYKFIGSFPHYVANGRHENTGRWHHEVVDLTAIHRRLWGDPAGARLVDLALFCDTDDTGGSSLAYVAGVSVRQRVPGEP